MCKRSIRKSRARKSPKRSIRKSRARKSPIRKRSMRKSRKCKKSQFRSRKSGYCRKRNCGSGRTRDIVTSLCRNKKSHKSIKRKSIRYKSSHNYSPLIEREIERQKTFESITKLVVDKDKEKVFSYLNTNTFSARRPVDDELEFQQTYINFFKSRRFLYRCITDEHLKFIKEKGYLTSASIDAKRSQNVSLAQWIAFNRPSQYGSTCLNLNVLSKHKLCKGRQYIISIDLKKFDFDIIIPLPEEMMKQHGEFVEGLFKLKTSNEKGTVYTEFINIDNPQDGIKDLRNNEITTNKVYLYPAYDRPLLNRWTSGMDKFNGELRIITLKKNIDAAEILQEVVFCGNIPLNALQIIAEKTNGEGPFRPLKEILPLVVPTKLGEEERSLADKPKTKERVSKNLPDTTRNKDKVLKKKKSEQTKSLDLRRFGTEDSEMRDVKSAHQPQLANKDSQPANPPRFNYRYRLPSDSE